MFLDIEMEPIHDWPKPIAFSLSYSTQCCYSTSPSFVPCNVRTIDDAHESLAMGYDVVLTFNTRKGTIKKEFRSIFYGAPEQCEALKTEIKRFREENRPYQNVKWYRLRRWGGEMVQDLKGITGAVNNADDQGVSISLTGGGLLSLRWPRFWKNWKPVSLDEVTKYVTTKFQIPTISDLNPISATELLIEAHYSNRIAQAAWDIWQRQGFRCEKLITAGNPCWSWDKISVSDWEGMSPYKEQRKQKVKELIDRAIT